jgi:tetratricopeptide (TPR) repeat protein
LTQQSLIYIYPVLFLILSVLIFIFRKKTPIIILGFVIAFISTLPTSGLIPFYYQTFSTVADRYFYIPLLGMSIIVAYIVGHVLNEKYRITAISIIGIILGLISFNQANNWKSEFSHWNNVISKSSIGIPQAFMGRGEEWITKGRYNEAISDFSEAIKIDPEGHVYYYNRGNAYMDLKKFEKAISDYTRTIELNPKYIDAYINRGLTYSEMIDTNSKYLAINDFRNALKINPNQPDALNSIGVIYAQMGKFDSALSFFSEVVKLNPNDAEAIENLKQVKTEIQKRNK